MCPLRTYQDKEGKTKCVPCPPGHFCYKMGLHNPVPCNKYKASADPYSPDDGEGDEINVCDISEIKQYDYHKWIKSIDELQSSIIEEVWQFDRKLNGSHIRTRMVSHSGLLVRVVGAPKNQYYMIQLLKTMHEDGVKYGDIYVDRIDDLEIKKVFLSSKRYYEWFLLKFYIPKDGKCPTSQWSLLDAYLRMYRASYRKYHGVYHEVYNNCHQAERAVRRAMGIYPEFFDINDELYDA